MAEQSRAAVSGVRQLLGPGRGHPSCWGCASSHLSETGAHADRASACWAVPSLSPPGSAGLVWLEPPASCGQPVPCRGVVRMCRLRHRLLCLAAFWLASVRRRAAPCFLLLLGLKVVSASPGQRESCMYSGPQENAFASTSSQRLFLKSN